MRPIRLALEGFACYSDRVDLDFSDLDVFVITGPTGAGKTTIVDAITYALYGRIPRATDPTDLIAHNRDRMRVSLEFTAERRQYRVHRGINTVRKALRDGRERIERQPSPVQVERLEPDRGWQPLEGGVQRVDDLIEKIVGLNFETFSRCVLLPQGRFQEFLTGDRNKRRDILYELLDMEIYERIMVEANKRSEAHAATARATTRSLEEQYAGATEEALAENSRHREETALRLERVKREVEAMQSGVELAATAADARRRCIDAQRAHDAKQGELAEAEALSRDGSERLAALKAHVEALESDRDRVGYDARLHALLSTLREKASQVREVARQLESVERAAADRTTADAARRAAQEATERLLTVERDRSAAEEALEAARQSDTAAHLRSGLRPGNPCPVCGAPILVIPAAGEGPNLRAIEEGLASAKDAERQARDGREIKEREAAKAELELDTARRRAVELKAALASAETQLSQGLPPGLSADYETLSAAFEAQRDASVRDEELRKQIDATRRGYDQLEPQVREGETRRAALQAEVATLERQAAEADSQAVEAIGELTHLARQWEWSAVLASIEEKQNPRPRLEQGRAVLGHESDDLTALDSRLEAQAERIRKDIETAVKLRADLAREAATAAIYKELGYLLQRNQFRDFVLEEALAILAANASTQLEALYPRFSLKVEKSEFHVVDHWQAKQARPASTLSGGETFVVSLALALALAQSLPQLRSAVAASLESLFIDEGFGTLDSETLDTVISALEELRARDRMVGIVTHVPELAQRIETRIIVQKAPEGSTVTVAGV